MENGPHVTYWKKNYVTNSTYVSRKPKRQN